MDQIEELLAAARVQLANVKAADQALAGARNEVEIAQARLAEKQKALTAGREAFAEESASAVAALQTINARINELIAELQGDA